MATLYGLQSSGAQDYIVSPEPATLSLLVVGGVLALVRRKRQMA
jgi:hypothetical protein